MSMAESNNADAVDGCQKNVVCAKGSPPSAFAFAGFERIRLRAEQCGIGLPIGLHMDPCDRRDVVKYSFADLDQPTRLDVFHHVKGYLIGHSMSQMGQPLPFAASSLLSQILSALSQIPAMLRIDSRGGGSCTEIDALALSRITRVFTGQNTTLNGLRIASFERAM